MTVTPPTEAPDLDALPVDGSGQEHPQQQQQQQQKKYPYLDEDLPPGRMHATRVPERLSGSYSSGLTSPGGGGGGGVALHHHVRRRSFPSEWTKPRSRSVSPSMRDTTGDSSISSLDDDSDILTDRMGLEELDFDKQRSLADGLSISSLPAVNERLSEDTLEDVHAFSDAVARSTGGSASSRANSICTGGDVGSLLLETLDEVDDEGEADGDGDGAGVHISNLDEIHEETATAPDGGGAPNLDDLPSEERNKAYFYTSEGDVPPLHLNAIRVPDRLSASHSSFFPSHGGITASPQSSKRKLLSGGGDATSGNYTHGTPTKSGMMKRKDGDGNASLSSMDAAVMDKDILTDRMGLEELDMEKQRSKADLMGSSASSLHSVNERLSEETLDDVHAFSDLVAGNGGSSRSMGAMSNSIATGDVGSLFLETLDEEDDEEDDEVLDEEGGAVHISNLANLTIQDDADAAAAAAAGTKPSDTSATATT